MTKFFNSGKSLFNRSISSSIYSTSFFSIFTFSEIFLFLPDAKPAIETGVKAMTNAAIDLFKAKD